MAQAFTPLYPILLRATVSALRTIFETGAYADKVIEQTLKEDKRRGARDRAFIAENVYEVVRWYRLLTALLGRDPETEADWWQLVGIRLLLKGAELPDWAEFAGLRREAVERNFAAMQPDRALRESIPDWLDQRGAAELGDQWPATLHALNEPAPLVLRTNTLKTTPQQLQAALAEDDIETQLLNDTALLVTVRRNLFHSKAFRQGWFEVQDYSSQQVAPFLAVEPGMRVIDACAGAGGKSLHLAALMKNRGRLIALDTEARKLHELRQRAARNGVDIIETRPITSSKIIKRLHHSADRLLLDAPCSGLGVLRRNPDAKWKLSPAFIERVRHTQQDILQRYSQMLRPGGRLVYATCSVLPSENEEQVRRFLESEAGRGFTLEAERTILPQEEGFDGFYMAGLGKE